MFAKLPEQALRNYPPNSFKTFHIILPLLMELDIDGINVLLAEKLQHFFPFRQLELINGSAFYDCGRS